MGDCAVKPVLPKKDRIPPSDTAVVPDTVELQYHEAGAVFSLTLDGDALKNRPLEMALCDDFDIDRWRHEGQKVTGKQTGQFKWVWIGRQDTFVNVLAALAQHGSIPEGQWREAVKISSHRGGKYTRGIADASWVDANGNAGFPYVEVDGNSSFCRTDEDFYCDGWIWLVKVSE